MLYVDRKKPGSLKRGLSPLNDCRVMTPWPRLASDGLAYGLKLTSHWPRVVSYWPHLALVCRLVQSTTYDRCAASLPGVGDRLKQRGNVEVLLVAWFVAARKQPVLSAIFQYS